MVIVAEDKRWNMKCSSCICVCVHILHTHIYTTVGQSHIGVMRPNNRTCYRNTVHIYKLENFIKEAGDTDLY